MLLFPAGHQAGEFFFHLACAAPVPGASASAQTARRGTRRNPASSAAKCITAGEAADPSTPTTTGPGPPWSARGTVDDDNPAQPVPRQLPGDRPQQQPGESACPREPTTTMSAVPLCSQSTRAGDPGTSSGSTPPRPANGSACARPRFMTSSPCCRTRSNSRGLIGSARSSDAQAWQTVSLVAIASLPGRPAQREFTAWRPVIPDDDLFIDPGHGTSSGSRDDLSYRS